MTDEKTFHHYNIYTGEKVYIEDMKVIQLDFNKEPKYCECCGKQDNYLDYWAITGHHTYCCRECGTKFMGLKK